MTNQNLKLLEKNVLQLESAAADMRNGLRLFNTQILSLLVETHQRNTTHCLSYQLKTDRDLTKTME